MCLCVRVYGGVCERAARGCTGRAAAPPAVISYLWIMFYSNSVRPRTPQASHPAPRRSQGCGKITTYCYYNNFNLNISNFFNKVFEGKVGIDRRVCRRKTYVCVLTEIENANYVLWSYCYLAVLIFAVSLSRSNLRDFFYETSKHVFALCPDIMYTCVQSLSDAYICSSVHTYI